MALITLNCPGTVFPSGVFNPGDGAPAGTWNDDSDATWSEGGDNEAVLDDMPPGPVPDDLTRVTVTAYVRYSGASPGQAIVNDATLDSTVLGANVFPGGAAAVPTWTSVVMSGDLDRFLTREVGGDFVLIIVGDQKVYEAYITVQLPGGVRPLMHYPRADGLAVGGVRQHYPAPNTVQARGSARCHYPATL